MSSEFVISDKRSFFKEQRFARFAELHMHIALIAIDGQSDNLFGAVQDLQFAEAHVKRRGTKRVAILHHHNVDGTAQSRLKTNKTPE
jgi:hypothetical protein